MIIDQLKNAGQYRGLSARIDRALEYLQQTDFAGMAPGKYEIDGDNVYARVLHYDSKTAAESPAFEAHRDYIDVQFVFAGAEQMGYAEIAALTVSKEYNAEKDALFLTGDGDFLTARAGTFAIFWPADAHLPGRALGAPSPVVKVVVKVKV